MIDTVETSFCHSPQQQHSSAAWSTLVISQHLRTLSECDIYLCTYVQGTPTHTVGKPKKTFKQVNMSICSVMVTTPIGLCSKSEWRNTIVAIDCTTYTTLTVTHCTKHSTDADTLHNTQHWRWHVAQYTALTLTHCTILSSDADTLHIMQHLRW